MLADTSPQFSTPGPQSCPACMHAWEKSELYHLSSKYLLNECSMRILTHIILSSNKLKDNTSMYILT